MCVCVCVSPPESPLTLAAQLDSCADLIKVLRNGGAHLDFRTRDGITALHKAVQSRNHVALTVSIKAASHTKWAKLQHHQQSSWHWKDDNANMSFGDIRSWQFCCESFYFTFAGCSVPIVVMTGVFTCPSHDHILCKLIWGWYQNHLPIKKKISHKVAKCSVVLV